MRINKLVVKIGAEVGTALLGIILVLAGATAFLIFLHFIGYVGALVFGWLGLGFGWLGAHSNWINFHMIANFIKWMFASAACIILLLFSYIIGKEAVDLSRSFFRIWRAYPRSTLEDIHEHHRKGELSNDA